MIQYYEKRGEQNSRFSTLRTKAHFNRTNLEQDCSRQGAS